MSYLQFQQEGENNMSNHSVSEKTIDVNNEKLYDLSMLYDMDDDEYVAQILTIFLRDVPKDLKDMKDGLSAGKINQVYSAAHKLKSSAGVIQAYRLSMLLEQIETMARAGELTSELANNIEEAKCEYNKIQPPLLGTLKGLMDV
jgi:HPt (histidine-containing phosphotransfer) domain-containing protein